MHYQYNTNISQGISLDSWKLNLDDSRPIRINLLIEINLLERVGCAWEHKDLVDVNAVDSDL